MEKSRMIRRLEDANTKCNEAVKSAEAGVKLSGSVSTFLLKDLALATNGEKVRALSARIGEQEREYESIAGKLIYIREHIEMLIEEVKSADDENEK